MTENRENWLYPEASGLYFPHDGFIMRASDGKQYDYEEECELLNEYDKKYNEYRNDVLRLEKENEQLKEENKELKSILHILQDMGVIMSNEEVKNVRGEIASKLIKPLCKGNGFDVDVNTENGFTIITKGVNNDRE